MRHSAWGSSDVPSPRWPKCGYGFHGIKSGVPPWGDVQAQEGEFFTKQWKHIFFFVGRLRLWSETIIELIKKTEYWPIAYLWLVSFWVGLTPHLPAISFFHKISEDPCFKWIETSWSSLDIPRFFQSVDLTYVKRDRLDTGLLVLERFPINELELASRYRFQKGLFWISKERQITNQLVQVFFLHLSVNGSL